MFRSTKYLIGFFANALAPAFCHAAADEFIQLDSKNLNELSRQIESIYKGLILGGRFPVYRYQVRQGDTVEAVIRRESGYSGSHFPIALDSIACDLNYTICSRELAIDGDSNREASGVVRMRSIFELESSYGNWNRLKEGDTIYLPAVTIQSTNSTQRYSKESGESFAAILRSLGICRGGENMKSECMDQIKYFNRNVGDFTATGFEGELYLPSVNYHAVISDECMPDCAIARFFTVNLDADIFVTPPFEIVDDKQEPTRKPDDVLLGIGEKLLGEDTISELKRLTPTELPSDIQSKQQVGLHQHFHRNQLGQLEFQQYPFARMASDETKLYSNVMIVDLNFEIDHCELKDVFVKVYDCSSRDIIGLDPDAAKCGVIEASADEHRDWPSCSDPGNVAIDTFDTANRAAVDDRHGTHLAGIIAAKHEHGGIGPFGSAGVNPFARLIGVKINKDLLSSDSQYALSLKSILLDLISRNSIDVVNFGYGYPFAAPDTPEGTRSCPYRDAILQLICNLRISTLFVTPAGNAEDDNRGLCAVYPACGAMFLDNILAVMALDMNGEALFPNAGNKEHAIGAIGKSVFGPSLKNRYAEFDGSSQASAYVAGAASLAASFSARWAPKKYVERFIACSDIFADFNLEHSKGGSLNIGCVINFQHDLVETNGETRAVDFVGLINSNNSGTINFIPFGSDIPIGIPFSLIVGFQQIGDDPNDIILYQEGALDDGLQRKRGNFNANPSELTLRFIKNGQITDIPLREISQYVRDAR